MSVVAPDRLKERVEQYAARNPDASLAAVLARFRLDPDEESDNEERALVEDVLAGEVERADADAPRGAADGPEVKA